VTYKSIKGSLLLFPGLLVVLLLLSPGVASAPSIPNPVLYFTGSEVYQVSGKEFIRYQFDVLNKADYPMELFAKAPELPPCGRNTNASRTWVDFYTQSGKRLYGFCALGKPDDLRLIWFALERNVAPPGYVYIELTDRQTNTKYKSNLAEITQNPSTINPTAKDTTQPNISINPPSTRIPEQSVSPPPQTGLGHYYALVIGNDIYQYVPNLKTAEDDARVVESVLRERFGFETKLLLNATRQDILSRISYYRRSLGENDNLLIYYAGHGYFDREADRAYWLPTDARRDDNANWISADDITSNIRAVPAKHVLIVADSCYSGTIYRGLAVGVSEPIARDKFLQKMISGKSRTLMASGGNEPVADGGGGGHSVFAKAFLLGLSQMEKDKFTATELFRDFVQERVAGAANQTPEYNPLRNSGHESGDFVFVRRK
jgi:hypothetical protein